MSKIMTAIRLIKKERANFVALIIMAFFNWLPDKIYLKLVYRYKMGEKLNLDSPRTYREDSVAEVIQP